MCCWHVAGRVDHFSPSQRMVKGEGLDTGGGVASRNEIQGLCAGKGGDTCMRIAPATWPLPSRGDQKQHRENPEKVPTERKELNTIIKNVQLLNF